MLKYQIVQVSPTNIGAVLTLTLADGSVEDVHSGITASNGQEAWIIERLPAKFAEYELVMTSLEALSETVTTVVGGLSRRAPLFWHDIIEL
jgi:hypothetical protein